LNAAIACVAFQGGCWHSVFAPSISARRTHRNQFEPSATRPPSDADNIAALNSVTDQLDRIAGDAKGAGAIDPKTT
jgi:hypothetical protein